MRNVFRVIAVVLVAAVHVWNQSDVRAATTLVLTPSIGQTINDIIVTSVALNPVASQTGYTIFDGNGQHVESNVGEPLS